MRFGSLETSQVAQARTDYPRMAQRGLASHIFENRYGTFYAMSNRSAASIYAAVRRYDANQKLLNSTPLTRRSRRTTVAA